MIKEKKGIALIAAIMLIVFVSTAVLGLSVFIVQWYSQLKVAERESRCIYNALAGINYAIWNYRANAPALPYNVTSSIDTDNRFIVSIPAGGGGGGASSAIVINAIASTLANSNRRVRDWTIRNNSASSVTINQVTVTWKKTPKRATSFVVNNVSRWTGSIATPPAVFSVSIIIPANTTYSNNQLNFNSSAAGDAGITLAFRMTDGTTTSPCTIYPAQVSTCVQASGSLTITSRGEARNEAAINSWQDRSVQATYNIATGNISNYVEVF